MKIELSIKSLKIVQSTHECRVIHVYIQNNVVISNVHKSLGWFFQQKKKKKSLRCFTIF